jgi:hypothetical protein
MQDKGDDDLQILCATQNLHKITLQRALDLRGQLSRTCATVFVPIIEQEEGKAGSKNKNSEDMKEKLSLFSSSLIDRTMVPPTAAEEVALRQVYIYICIYINIYMDIYLYLCSPNPRNL